MPVVDIFYAHSGTPTMRKKEVKRERNIATADDECLISLTAWIHANCPWVMPCIIMQDLEGAPEKKTYFIRWHPRLSALIGDLLGTFKVEHAVVKTNSLMSIGFGADLARESLPDRQEVIYTIVRSTLPPPESCFCFFALPEHVEVEPLCGCELLTSMVLNTPMEQLVGLLMENWPFEAM
jgi:hypothetical protein